MTSPDQAEAERRYPLPIAPDLKLTTVAEAVRVAREAYINGREDGSALAEVRAERDEALATVDFLHGVARSYAAECERLKAERLNLDRRIHNQRVALRQNWEIVDMRAGHLRNKEVRSKYLGYWSKAEAKVRAAHAECDRQRGRAEKAEAEAQKQQQHLFSTLQSVADIADAIRAPAPEDISR